MEQFLTQSSGSGMVKARAHLGVLFWPISLTIGLVWGVANYHLLETQTFWQTYQPWSKYVLFFVGTVVVLFWVAKPVLCWIGNVFKFTTSRFVLQQGIWVRKSRDVLLTQIVDIKTKQTFLGRLFGYGTLEIELASGEKIRVKKLGKVRKLSGQLTELVSRAQRLAANGKTLPGYLHPNRQQAHHQKTPIDFFWPD